MRFMMGTLGSLLLLFMICSMGSAKVEKCPYGWTNFGVRCYKHFPQTVNWVTAEKNCLGLDANLASIHSKAEDDFLLSLLPASTSCWVGAHDGEIDGHWFWSDGSPHDFTNWCPEQPDNSGGPESCTELNWGCVSNRDPQHPDYVPHINIYVL